MDLIEPITIGCFVLGGVMGAFLAMVALCNAPRTAEEQVTTFLAGFRAGYREGLTKSHTRPGDEA